MSEKLEDVYSNLSFAPAPSSRPTTFINMVATIDGKTVSGEPGEDVMDLGSPVDHALMRRLQDASDAVLIGGNTLRATSPKWNPGTRFRVVVSRKANFDYSVPFFLSGGVVATPESCRAMLPSGVEHLRIGKTSVDLPKLLDGLRTRGVEKLLCFGGSELNAELLRCDLIDELFLTIAPKIKLGRSLPTYAGGEPLPRSEILGFEVVELHRIQNEVFLRYRRSRSAS